MEVVHAVTRQAAGRPEIVDEHFNEAYERRASSGRNL